MTFKLTENILSSVKKNTHQIAMMLWRRYPVFGLICIPSRSPNRNDLHVILFLSVKDYEKTLTQ